MTPDVTAADSGWGAAKPPVFQPQSRICLALYRGIRDRAGERTCFMQIVNLQMRELTGALQLSPFPPPSPQPTHRPQRRGLYTRNAYYNGALMNSVDKSRRFDTPETECQTIRPMTITFEY